MELKGSQARKNLMSAFAGESQARNRYTFFASQAKKEGYEQIVDWQDTYEMFVQETKITIDIVLVFVYNLK